MTYHILYSPPLGIWIIWTMGIICWKQHSPNSDWGDCCPSVFDTHCNYTNCLQSETSGQKLAYITFHFRQPFGLCYSLSMYMNESILNWEQLSADKMLRLGHCITKPLSHRLCESLWIINYSYSYCITVSLKENILNSYTPETCILDHSSFGSSFPEPEGRRCSGVLPSVAGRRTRATSCTSSPAEPQPANRKITKLIIRKTWSHMKKLRTCPGPPC